MNSFHTREHWINVPFGIWKDFYEVSSKGRVKNKLTGYVLTSCIGKNGYATVTLKSKPHKWCVAVHTLVLCAFRGSPPSSKHECCHNNSVRSDNHLENLRWGTRRENHHDKFALQRTGRKFSDSQISEIKKMLKSGEKDYTIAKQFKVGSQTIKNIREGKTYFV